MAQDGYHGGSSLQLQDLSFHDGGRQPLLDEAGSGAASTAGGGVALSEEQQLEVDMRIINEHPDKSSDFARGLGSQEVAHRL